MDSGEVSQNVLLAVFAAPLLSALVDAIKRHGPAWMSAGQTPALIAEVLGGLLGALAYFTVTPLYSVHGQPPVYPAAPLAVYLAAGFVVGLTAVGLHAQIKAGTTTAPASPNPPDSQSDSR